MTLPIGPSLESVAENEFYLEVGSLSLVLDING